MVRCDVFEPLRYEGGGSLEIHGERISYHTVSEDTVFYDGCGKPIASVFSSIFLNFNSQSRGNGVSCELAA